MITRTRKLSAEKYAALSPEDQLDYDLALLVEGIAVQYAKGRDGQKFDEQIYLEHRQELYVKAYALVKEHPDASINYIASSLWHRAGDMMRETVRDSQNMVEYPYQENVPNHIDTDTTWNGREISTMIQHESGLQTQNNHEEFITHDLVKHILKLISKQPDDVQKYVIAKLKLNGYLSMDAYPEVQVDIQQFDQAQDTEHYKILTDILNMPNAESGGLSTFKKNKQHLFRQLMTDFGVEKAYKKWYYVTYRDLDDTIKKNRVKGYSAADVESHAMTPKKMKHIKEIISISTEE